MGNSFYVPVESPFTGLDRTLSLGAQLYGLKQNADRIALERDRMGEVKRQHNITSFGTETPQPGMPTIATRQLDETARARTVAENQLPYHDRPVPGSLFKQRIDLLKNQFGPAVAKPLAPVVDELQRIADDPRTTPRNLYDYAKELYPQKREEIVAGLQSIDTSKLKPEEFKRWAAAYDAFTSDETGDKVLGSLFGRTVQSLKAEEANSKAKMGVQDWVKVVGPDGKPVLVPASADLTGQTPYIEQKPPTIRSVDRGNVVDIYENGVKVRTEKKGASPSSSSGLPEIPGGGGVITGPGEKNVGALQGLTNAQQETIKAIAEYRFPVSNLRNKEMMGLVQRAYLYDPTFDAKEYAVRAKLRSDFTSGKGAVNIRSLNTAVGHLESLSKAANALDNAPVQLWNMIANKGLTGIGDSRVTNFNTAATAVAGELATVFKSTSGTDQEIKAWRENISASQSPEQLKESIQTAIELLGGRLGALQAQYETGLGRKADFTFLSPKSRKILTSLGWDVQKLDPTGTAGQVVGPTVKVPKVQKIGRFTVEAE